MMTIKTIYRCNTCGTEKTGPTGMSTRLEHNKKERWVMCNAIADPEHYNVHVCSSCVRELWEYQKALDAQGSERCDAEA